MRWFYRLLQWAFIRDQKHLDLLRPLSHQTAMVRRFEREVADIATAAESLDLPFHAESLHHAQRDLTGYRRSRRKTYRECLKAGLSKKQIRWACRA